MQCRSLACAFSIVIASGCPLLSHLVPDAESLLKDVISATQQWASPGSSAESIGWMLKTISQKQRLARPQWKRLFSGTTASTVDGYSAAS